MKTIAFPFREIRSVFVVKMYTPFFTDESHTNTSEVIMPSNTSIIFPESSFEASTDMPLINWSVTYMAESNGPIRCIT